MKTKFCSLCITLILLMGARQAASQIVANGDFETGDFTGWTQSGDFVGAFVDNGSQITPYSGSHEAILQTYTSTGYLSQTLSTTAGAVYLLSFSLINPSQQIPNDFSVSWNGTTILNQPNFVVPVWTNIQLLVTSPGTSTTIQFGYQDQYIEMGFDDVSVVPVAFLHFSATPTNGAAPLMVQFASPGVDNSGNSVTNWNWSFGDGSTSTNQNPVHTYTNQGDFIPSLIATNIHGSRVFGIGPSIAAVPPNDNFANRTQLMNAGFGNNLAATLEPNEPSPGGGIGSVTNTATNQVVSVLSVTNTVTNSVWWSWTAPTNGPASVITSGSTFDTIIDVYTGNALSSLVCITSNLNSVLDDDLYSYGNPSVGVFNPANAGILNRVGFTASAGTTYQIQVSGLSEGPIDIAVQPIALKVLSVHFVSTNSDGSINFNAMVEIGNSGSTTSAPLNLEVLARAGYSFDSNNSSRPATNTIPADQVLTNYTLSNPTTVLPGTATNISISGVCPGPVYVVTSGNTNSGFGWGVYAVLQEQFGTNSYFMDNDLLFYGQWPTISGVVGQAGGVIRVDPSQLITASDPAYVEWQLAPPAAVRAGAGWKLASDPVYSTTAGYVEAVTSTNSVVVQFKPIPGWSLPANQTLTVLPGQVTSQTAFYTVTNPILMLGKGIGLGITGTTGTVYELESRTSLLSGSWVPVSTNTIQSNGFNSLLSNPTTNGPVNFYRAVWLP